MLVAEAAVTAHDLHCAVLKLGMQEPESEPLAVASSSVFHSRWGSAGRRGHVQ